MRLFLAFSLSSTESRAVYTACERFTAEEQAPLRWVPADNWHVTVVFLGEVAEHLLSLLAELVEPVVARYQYLSLNLDRLVWFPNTSKARLLALAGEPGQPLQHLQQNLASELRRHGFTIEQRAWRPHLTLARYRGARKRFDPFALPATPAVDLQLDRLSLLQSVAGPAGTGPRYLPLQHFELSP
ncbi:MAG: RNA 2',3'-cyclic phosphodiesterase [Gammaproteobacteria bacterium]|nr:RNA 2',3'-cyclic phosphodiesterase [Gammaproteobacteria bacterium]